MTMPSIYYEVQVATLKGINLKDSQEWYCDQCVSPCLLCKLNVNDKENSIECAKCKSQIHNNCALDTNYSIQSSNCSWHCPCPGCNFGNTSSFFSNKPSNILSNNIYQTLSGAVPPENQIHNEPKFCRSIKVVSLNINGLRGKRLELQAFLASEEPEVVAIQETKIDKGIMSNEMIPDFLEYEIFRTDRNGNGGGTMLLVKKWLKPEPINSLNNGAESTWCYVTIHGTKHFFSSWYRPPSANTAYINLLKNQIDIIKMKEKKHTASYPYLW